MTDIINDVSILTTIPEKNLNKISKKMVYCICEAIEEDQLAKKDISELDIGIGILYIKHENADNIKYHFEPSQYLETAISDTITNKKNIIENVFNESLTKKFAEIYKDLC